MRKEGSKPAFFPKNSLRVICLVETLLEQPFCSDKIQFDFLLPVLVARFARPLFLMRVF
ncbi:hypothetical protein [Martelella mediterranea]|uniref:Uncharacterized protein n=1 Tax=Martelella mediterranea TaxID=293089 RepID=A0A4R3NXT0_9HYPH|nr:hypothetical protein [Martelella mediterranea]TCT44570.1 hypothetical protein EDC90_1002119 [Martelella mediterranea]